MRKCLFLMILFILALAACQSPSQTIIPTVTTTGSPTYSSPSSSSNKQIVDICVYTMSIGYTAHEDRIDLANHKYYQYSAAGPDETRDPQAGNQGYQSVYDLDEKNVDVFLTDVKKYGITDWNDLYYNDHISDVYQCGLDIVFSDGTKKSIYCSCLFPESWNDMAEAFKRLTGEYVISPIDPDEFD